MTTTPALRKARAHCLHHGFRYTEPRARVLNILINERKPLGAYDILQRLAKEMINPKPPTVYRAIQFWHQEGFIHCIDSLKSYVACMHGHHLGQAQFLICYQCSLVAELDCNLDYSSAKTIASSMQFSITSCTTEYKGLCHHCSKQAST